MTSRTLSIPAGRAAKAAAFAFIAALGFACISVTPASAHSNSSSNGHYSYDSHGNAYWSSSSDDDSRDNDWNRGSSWSWNHDGRDNDWNRSSDDWNDDRDNGNDNYWNRGNSGNSCRNQNSSSYSVNGYYSYDSHGVAHWNTDDSRSSNRCD
ncbi:MAG TPA: hypothetical protein VF439_03025 [Candidatus Paceibacterota bacterium]